MSTWLTPTIGDMGDARHKRKYVDGERIQMTPKWKQRVRDRLAENKRHNVEPRDQVELAASVGARDKSAITKMFKASASKLVPAICRVLQIPMPMQERKDGDDLDQFVDDLSPEKRERALQILRLTFDGGAP